MVRSLPFEERFFAADARALVEAVRIPIVLVGGVVSRAGLDAAMADGFAFVAMGRALLADPDFVERVRRGELERSRCTACNACVATAMDRTGVRCVLDDEVGA